MPTQTRALTLAAKDADWKLETIELDDPLPDEVVVQYVATGICHTDVSVQSGVLGIALPAVVGHEGAGKVVAVGSNVKKLQVGDSVLTSFTSCSNCNFCKDAKPHGCKDWAAVNFGAQRSDGSTTAASNGSGERLGMHFLGQSSFSNHALVAEQACVKVSGDTNLKLCASLGCGIQTGYGAVRNILKADKNTPSLLIVGLGTVGMSAVIAAVNAGVPNIIGCDIVESRLQLAKSFGAHHVVNTGRDGFKDEIMKLTGEGPERVVECSGVPACIDWAFKIMRNTGIHLQVGAPAAGTPIPFDIQELIITAKSFVGGLEGSSDLQTFIPFLVDQYKQGKLPLDKISKTFPIESFKEAFEAAHSGSVIKPILVF